MNESEWAIEYSYRYAVLHFFAEEGCKTLLWKVQITIHCCRKQNVKLFSIVSSAWARTFKRFKCLFCDFELHPNHTFYNWITSCYPLILNWLYRRRKCVYKFSLGTSICAARTRKFPQRELQNLLPSAPLSDSSG